MKRNNKGYSLIELVMTLAIFSIIMVAIILMMRTTIASYKEGYFETSLQEEAQVVANQVADVLVDATVYSDTGDTYSYDDYGNVTGVAGKTYSFVGPDATIGSNAVVLSSTGNELKLNGHLLTDQLATNGFEITGLNRRATDDTTTVYDNSATVKITIDSDGRQYTATKDIYFRNQIEYNDTTDFKNPYDVSGAPTITSGGGSGEFSATILRYHPYNLSLLDDIVYDAELSEKAGYYFTLTESANTQIKNKPSSVASKTPHTYVITVTAEGDYTNNNSSVRDQCYVTGLNSQGESVKVLLVLDRVYIEEGNGMYISKTNTGQMSTTGFTTNVHIKGIDVNEALKKSTPIPISFTAEITSDGGTKCTYADRALNKITSDVADNITNNAKYLPDANTDDIKYELCVAPCPSNGEVLISCGGNSGGDTNAFNNNHYGFLGDTNKDNKLKLTFKIGPATDLYTTNTAEYTFLFTGQSLEKVNNGK